MSRAPSHGSHHTVLGLQFALRSGVRSASVLFTGSKCWIWVWFDSSSDIFSTSILYTAHVLSNWLWFVFVSKLNEPLFGYRCVGLNTFVSFYAHHDRSPTHTVNCPGECVYDGVWVCPIAMQVNSCNAFRTLIPIESIKDVDKATVRCQHFSWHPLEIVCIFIAMPVSPPTLATMCLC